MKYTITLLKRSPFCFSPWYYHMKTFSMPSRCLQYITCLAVAKALSLVAMLCFFYTYVFVELPTVYTALIAVI